MALTILSTAKSMSGKSMGSNSWESLGAKKEVADEGSVTPRFMSSWACKGVIFDSRASLGISGERGLSFQIDIAKFLI
jgi:hypothetical protein